MPKDISRLIPIRKPVVDLRKGLIIRTYYYKPEKLLQSLEKLKEEPNINYFTITPFYDEYDNYLKTNDPSMFHSILGDTWDSFSKLNKNVNVPFIKPSENNVLYKTFSLLLSGEKIFTKGLKKDAKEISKHKTAYIVKEEIRPKRKKKKPDLKELFIDTKIKYKIIEDQRYIPSKTGILLSNTINFFNPKKPKLQIIYKSFLGSDYIDDSYISYHIILSERSINRIPDIFINVARTTLKEYFSPYKKLKRSVDIDFLSKYIPYILIEIFKLDQDLFNSIKSLYNDKYVYKFFSDITKSYLSDDKHIRYAQYVAMTKDSLNLVLEQTVISNKNDHSEDYTIIRALSMRKDISPSEFDKLFNRFINKYRDYYLDDKMFVSHLFKSSQYGEKDIFSTVLQMVLSNHYKLFYVPLGKDFSSIEFPECGSIMYLLTNSYFTRKSIIDKFNKLFIDENKSKIFYIPVIKEKDFEILSGDISAIPFRLLNFHIMFDDLGLAKQQFKDWIFAKVKFDRYFKCKILDGLYLTNFIGGKVKWHELYK